jgi:hypothetical protein
MSQRRLFRGAWKKPAAALLLSAMLPMGFSTVAALAEGESAEQSAPAPDKAASGVASKPAETRNQPAGEAPKAAPAEAKPAEAAKAEPQQTDQPAAPKETKAEAQAPAAAAEAQPAAPKDVKAEAKPEDSKAGDQHSGPEGGTQSKQAEQPAGDGSAAAAPKAAKPEAKPAGPKEAATPAKPRDLTPKPANPESLAVQASTVNAVYHIHFLGANIGDFKIRSSITNRQYSLQANADVSFLFGTMSWKGVTTSHGLMTANGPVPQNYSFRYATNDRREAIELRFQQRMVQDIIINPPAHPGARSVPITAADLQNVVDPLSAVVLLSQARLARHSGDACNKRLPIFDGKVRYDLLLSPKGTRTIGNAGRLRGTAYVCAVSYIPISGHKLGKSGDFAAGNTGIEIWLVPVPEAGLLVPYYIHVPTAAGTASLVTAKLDVETPGGRHALAD